MLVGFVVLLLFTLLGQVAAGLTGLPVPGPVWGMALLGIALSVWKKRAAPLEQAADALLRNMALLFVPAGVGVMKFADTLRAEWFPVLAVLLLATTLTVVVTALTLKGCMSLQARWLSSREPE